MNKSHRHNWIVTKYDLQQTTFSNNGKKVSFKKWPIYKCECGARKAKGKIL